MAYICFELQSTYWVNTLTDATHSRSHHARAGWTPTVSSIQHQHPLHPDWSTLTATLRNITSEVGCVLSCVNESYYVIHPFKIRTLISFLWFSVLSSHPNINPHRHTLTSELLTSPWLCKTSPKPRHSRTLTSTTSTTRFRTVRSDDIAMQWFQMGLFDRNIANT